MKNLQIPTGIAFALMGLLKLHQMVHVDSYYYDSFIHFFDSFIKVLSKYPTASIFYSIVYGAVGYLLARILSNR